MDDFTMRRSCCSLCRVLAPIGMMALVLSSAAFDGATSVAGDEPQPGSAPPAAAAPAKSPLISRGRVQLNLAGAERILSAARAKAESMKLNVNIAVVDDGGHLIAFVRMDGARPASVATALTKASAAATLRQSTGPIPPGTATPDLLLNLSLQNAAAASGGKITTLYGGVPVVVDEQVIGGVGVGGGTGQQDAEIARAGIDDLLSVLKSK